MTKQSRRRHKQRAKHSAMDLAPVERREKDGRICRADRSDYERDPTVTAINARVRLMGWTSDSAKADARQQSLEGQAGMAIHIGAASKPEVARLWRVFTSLHSAEMAYAAHYLGARLYAKTANLEIMPEITETRPDDKPDRRTREQRARDAVNAWMRWQGSLGRLTASERTSLYDAVLCRCDMVRDGRLTTAGKSFVAAARVLAAVVER